jgi:hypothetical protein
MLDSVGHVAFQPGRRNPVVGSTCGSTANTIISINPNQKVGIEIPKNEPAVTK